MRREHTASIALRMGDESVRVPVQIPEPEMRLADLAGIAYALTQAVADLRERDAATGGRPIACRARCTPCCHQLVPISAPEALLLADVIDSLGDQPRAALLDRFAHVEVSLDRHNVAERLSQSRGSAGGLRLVANEYFARRIPCPFLVDDLCSIRPQRPVACRSHSVTSPAAWCGEPAAHRIEPLPMPPHLSVPLARVAAELIGEGAVPLALSLLPAWLRAHAELRRRTWPSARLVARFLAEVGAWPDRPGVAGDGAAALVEDGQQPEARTR